MAGSDPTKAADPGTYLLRPIGTIRSALKDRRTAPRQRSEGAPEASIELEPSVLEGLQGIEVGQEVTLITWLHQARREVLESRAVFESPRE